MGKKLIAPLPRFGSVAVSIQRFAMLPFASRSILRRAVIPKKSATEPPKTMTNTRIMAIEGQKTMFKAGLLLNRVSSTLSAHRTFKVVSRGYCSGVASAPAKTAPKGKNQVPQSSIGNLDIRVGRIVHVARHPHADTLYVEKIDVGEPAPRIIISGLVKYMTLDELNSKSVLVLCNLPSKEMRSIASHGMVLAASSTNPETGETKVALVEPPQNSVPGEAVFVNGEASDIIQGISGNKLDKILKRCKVNADGIATFTTSDGSANPIQTASGPCTSTLANASIA